MPSINHLLAVRSDFSLGESLLKPAEIIESASVHGFESVAIMDTMTVSSMVDFTSRADKAGVKPIIGCRLRIVDDPTYRKPKRGSGEKEKKNPAWYPKVYVLNHDGMKDLIDLLTRANSREYFYYEARLGFDDLIEVLSRGNLAVSTGDFYSVFHREDYAAVVEKMWRACSAAQTFIEIPVIDTPLFDQLNERAIKLAGEHGLSAILTYPVLYETPADADTLDVLAAINSNTQMSAPWRSVPYVRDFAMYEPRDLLRKAMGLKTRLKKWHDLDVGLSSAAEGMQKLVDLCEYHWEKQPVSLPQMATDEYAALVTEAKRGWVERLSKPMLGYKPDASILPLYKDRLKFELETLKNMGFERYFLVVQDLVRWSKQNDIMVGPGRGSVGGSLVAYLLGITDVDPIRFNLLFERFINPERLDLPDADLDFMSSRRHEVIEYLVGRYGEERVAGISNYSTLASASALRDAGRVHEIDQKELACTKYVPKEHGQSLSLDAAAEVVPEIQAFKDAHTSLWRHATRLEGRMRSLGQHAAGIVVAGEPIRNRAVVIEKEGGVPVVNWDKRVVEDWGLVKMDILGLSTLDVLTKAKNYVKHRHGVTIDLTALPLDDGATLKALGEGKSVGVFQFESGGMRKLLKDLAMGGDLTFEDLAAATALYRPGPMDSGLMDDYVAIKQGAKTPHYEHPNMEAALSPTHSVIIYQEQIMQLAQDLAGFTLAGADHLRKAMGKKDRVKMAEMREKWVKGCEEHSGMEEKQAGALFDKIEAFAGYGFNRSHAVEYSVISFWTMWFKVNYPAEFYAASLSVNGEDKLPQLVKDAQERGIYVAPPDINLSGMDFEIHYDAKREQTVLYAPFNRLKGLSDNTTKAILDAREKHGKPFASQAEFLAAVNKTKCNKRHQSVLEQVGAFASIEPTQLSARHPDRLKEQMVLMPGLIVEVIKADRRISIDPHTKGEIIKMVHEVRSCEKCDLAGGVHPTPRLGKAAKFMVVTDAPNWGEERASKMLEGDASAYLKKAIKEAGLTPNDGYFTSLVKSPKTEKQLTNDQINGCGDYLKREVEVLKPPVIVALGGAAIRYFMPDAKGGFAELCGQVHYIPALDASVVFGINPMMCYVDSSRQEMLDDVFRKVAEIVQ